MNFKTHRLVFVASLMNNLNGFRGIIVNRERLDTSWHNDTTLYDIGGIWSERTVNIYDSIVEDLYYD